MSDSLNDKLEAFLRAHPDEWFDGMQLGKVAGRYAWRSRCSDLRRFRGMTIKNRKRRVLNAEGKPYTVSEYRFLRSRPVSLLDVMEDRKDEDVFVA